MTTTGYPANNSAGFGAAVSIRRYVNDEIAQKATALDAGDGGGVEFVCECGDLSCPGLVKMALTEYRASAPGSVVGH